MFQGKKNSAESQQGKSNSSFFGLDKSPSNFFQAQPIQTKLEIGEPGDKYEQEADAMSEQVMKMDQNRSQVVQRKCEDCDDSIQKMEEEETAQTKLQMQSEEEEPIQRKCESCQEKETVQQKPLKDTISTIQQKSESTNSGSNDQLEKNLSSSRGSGSGMDGQTLESMNQSFGHDFSSVKIHTNSNAVQMNQQLGARAFTNGSNVYFNQGQYNPSSNSGKQLLAHELTHVVQQRSGMKLIQRACDTAAVDKKVEEIKKLDLYNNIQQHKDTYTPKKARERVDEIIVKAKSKDDCLKYINYLHVLFSTEENPKDQTKDKWAPKIEDAAKEETDRLKGQYAKDHKEDEETGAQDSARAYSKKKGRDDKIYYVDATDPQNIFIKLKVRLKSSKANKKYLKQIKAIEDIVEKTASVQGYSVDLDFVEKSGSDVFDAEVNPSKWPTSGNWVGNAEVMAHELHHLLGLKDRYNYIESHHKNKNMYVANRIHWFWVEINRNPDPLKMISFMGKGDLVTEQDICESIQSNDIPACIKSREKITEPATLAMGKASAKAQKVREIMAGISSRVMSGDKNAEMMLSIQQKQILRIGQTIFGKDVDDQFLIDGARNLVYILLGKPVQMLQDGSDRCNTTSPIIPFNSPASFLICPTFLALSEADRIKAFLSSGIELSRLIKKNALTNNKLTAKDKGENWSKFIIKARAVI